MKSSAARTGQSSERQHIFLLTKGSVAERTPKLKSLERSSVPDKATSPDFLKFTEELLPLLLIGILEKAIKCVLEAAEVEVACFVPEGRHEHFKRRLVASVFHRLCGHVDASLICGGAQCGSASICFPPLADIPLPTH